MSRAFPVADAERTLVPLTFGIVGPSSSGKTFSALRIAEGMRQGVLAATGEDRPVVMIDTENRRALHYAEAFDFKHLDFQPPFGSLDYLDALGQAAAMRPAAIVVDSMTHEHEGEGGLLDLHATTLDRMSGGDPAKAERVKMLAWKDPKQHRRKLLNGIVRLNVNLVLCFRASEKAKPEKGDGPRAKTEVTHQGFVAQAAREFVYEMAACAMLYPNARGVPTWRSTLPGESMTIKRPTQFERLFQDGEALCEEHGRQMALWAAGGTSMEELRAEGAAMAARGTGALRTFWAGLSAGEQKMLQAAKDEAWKPAAEVADTKPEPKPTETGDAPF